MDHRTADLLSRIAAALAEQFGASCEVAVHDLSGADPEHTIVAIENGGVSARKPGDGPSRVVLEAMREPDPSRLRDQLGYLMKTPDGRVLKCSTVYVRDENDALAGVLSINYDMTELFMARRAVDSLINHAAVTRPPQRIAANVNDLLDDLISQSVALVGKPVALMNKEDKIRAIHFLNDAGAFLITKSGDKVTKYFGISKFTLYSYLDARLDGEPEQDTEKE
ncbi:MAG: transcriptional regulator [Firmicutes bacterium]|nr:transcriptional regulator [Bacillota bacterium]